MSIEIVVGMSDSVGACRDKLCRIEDKMKLLSVLVRALPHNASGTSPPSSAKTSRRTNGGQEHDGFR